MHDPQPPLVSYCLNNVSAATRAALRACHAILAEEEGCLGRCGYCYEGPFLVLDDRLVTGDSHEAILTDELGARVDALEESA
jgi:uncharacterized protein YuzB (UPF0349 family)